MSQIVFSGIDRMINTQVRPLTTNDYHRNTKAPIYATAGISEYWIVNLIDNRLEIYSQPEGSIYTNTQIVLPPRLVNLPHFSDIAIDLATIFPPRIS